MMRLLPVVGRATVNVVAGVDAKAPHLAPLERARNRVIRLHRLYFFLLKHDLLDPEASPRRGIYWRRWSVHMRSTLA